jgi:hypothetical protein
VNDAASVEAGATLTIKLEVLDPELLVEVNVTVYKPEAVNTWLGFCSVLVEPSLKFQYQELGAPVEVSVN